MNSLHGGVSGVACRGQIFSPGSYAQDPPAVSDDLIPHARSAGMKDFDVGQTRRFFQAPNGFPVGIMARIAPRSHDHADRYIVAPLNRCWAECPSRTSLYQSQEITFQAGQINLRFGVPKTRVELKH